MADEQPKPQSLRERMALKKASGKPTEEFHMPQTAPVSIPPAFTPAEPQNMGSQVPNMNSFTPNQPPFNRGKCLRKNILARYNINNFSLRF